MLIFEADHKIPVLGILDFIFCGVPHPESF